MSSKKELLEALRRKTIGDITAPREPPSIAALMDNAASALLKPKTHLPHYVELLQMDLEEAYDCLDAIGDALPMIKNEIKRTHKGQPRYRGPVPEDLVKWRKERRAS